MRAAVSVTATCQRDQGVGGRGGDGGRGMRTSGLSGGRCAMVAASAVPCQRLARAAASRQTASRSTHEAKTMGEQQPGKPAGGGAAAAKTGRTLTERLAACYTGAVHDVLRMMGHDDIVLPPDDQGDRAGHAARRPGLDGRRATSTARRSRARDAARLVHAARAGARGPRRRLPAEQPRGRADGRAVGADAAGARRAAATSSTAARATPTSCSSRASRCSARS